MIKQKYVVLEGLDFAGKSRLAKQLAETLNWRLVNEPFTETEHAAEVKRMNNANYLPKYYEMMMIIASRIECFDQVVSQHRQSGLISDRNVVSSMVYQSTERFPPSTVYSINAKVLGEAGHVIAPDYLFFLDITHETFLERLGNCNRPVDAKDLWLKAPGNWKIMRDKYLHALGLLEVMSPDTYIEIITPETTIEEIIAKIK